MDFGNFWNTITGRIVAIAVGVVIIWLGLEMTKPLGYVFEAIGAVLVIAAVVNINRVGRRDGPEL